MGRIRYGIKNVYYAVATEGTGGALTYATPIAVPGAKSISLAPQGDSVDEYADNVVWYHEDTNSGYTGDLEFEDTAAADTFLATVLGHTVDSTTGVVTEKADDQAVEFALMFQFELGGANETGKRACFVRCKASRPTMAGQTKEGSLTVATNTVSITAMPRVSDDVVKKTCVSTDSAYETWFNEV